MRKRKVEESTAPLTSSQEFTSLISKYSFSAASLDHSDTKPLSKPSTSLKTSQPRSKKACPTPRLSPGKSRNPGYAPPSTYSHLPTPDLDCLAHNLILVFIGLNPGVATALANHAFAGATNKFWPLLYSSGITTLRHTCHADKSLPALYRVGNTNLIPRPTRCASELSKEEMLSHVDIVEEKIRLYKPTAVCVVGKGIWDVIYERKSFGKKVGKDFQFGWQKIRMGSDGDGWNGAKCFVTPSTSGRVAAYSREFQEDLWKELGRWVSTERGDVKNEMIDEVGQEIKEEADKVKVEFDKQQVRDVQIKDEE